MSTGPVALLGVGEVGTILAQDLAARGHDGIRAWDILFRDPGSRPSATLSALPALRGATGATDAVSGARVVISAVTAGEDVTAARAAAPGLACGAWYLDLNSVAPETRVEAARIVAAAGARYVEGAVMSPVPPRRIGVPILLGGPDARAFLAVAEELGFSGASCFADEIGRASAAKMCRSVVVKGMEALLGEALVAARHYGVERDVLASLGDLFPEPDWAEKARYMISRSIEHGTRRAEEMEEVAKTVRASGLDPHMSEATVRRQRWAAQFAPARDRDLIAMLDEIRATAAAKRGRVC